MELCNQEKVMLKMGYKMRVLKEIHNKDHFGVNRTWYLARMSMRKLKKEDVVKCIRNCGTCQSIDPVPV